jgi:hypothetical protein
VIGTLILLWGYRRLVGEGSPRTAD